MSWSVSARGQTPGIAAEIERQFEGSGQCVEPEETSKQAARKIIADTIAMQGIMQKLTVSAYGSQVKNPTTSSPAVSLSIIVTAEF